MNFPSSTPPLTLAQTPRDPESLEAEQQAANFLGVTTRTLQKWRTNGKGPPFVRISARCVRYRRRDLIEWVEARLKSSTTQA